MSRPVLFTIQPQRYNGRGWVSCEAHRAQQWAVVRSRGRKVISVVARYSTKAMAEQVRASEAQRALGPYRPYPKPGARLLQRPMTTERCGWDASLEADDAFLRGDLR